MKKSSLIAGISAVIVLALAVFIYSWSLGKVDEVAALSNHIEVIEGSAEVKKADQAEFAMVNGTSTKVEAGDTVKAGSGAIVEVVWGDQGVTRLEDGSEFVIESAPVFDGGESPALTLKLTAGRIWSRMVKVLDLDKPMQVRAGDVVATVRGTTYGIALAGDDTMIVVDESVVSYTRGNQNETMIADLQTAFIGDGGKADNIVSAEQDEWRLAQQQKDFSFDQRYAEWILKRETKRSARIQKAPKLFVRIGENMRLLTAGSKRSELAAKYARRSMAVSIIDPDQADKAMIAMKKRFKASDKNSKQVIRELNAMQSFMNRTNLDGPKDFGVRPPSSSLMKKMREQRKALAVADIDQLYRETLDIDEDIDQLLYMADERRDESITIASLLTRIDAVDKAAKNLKQEDTTALEKKLAALRRRLERWFDIKSSTKQQEPKEEKTKDTTEDEVSDIPGIPGSKPTTIKPPKTDGSQPTESPTTRIYQRIELVPTPSSLALGERTTVKAFGVRADGGVDEITSQVRFAPRYSADGSFSGNVFRPAVTGVIVLNGTFIDPQGSRTASVSISVNDGQTVVDPKALVSIAILTTSPTDTSCGATIPFKVMGTYGDGSREDVTARASYGTSDSKLAYVGDAKILVFCTDIKSKATITARVTDAGITKSGSITVTVTPEPPSNNSGSGQSGYPFTYVP